MGIYALSNCTGLSTITFSGTQDQWNAIQKGDNYYPIFYCIGAYAEAEGEYGGYLFAHEIETASLKCTNINTDIINSTILNVKNIYSSDPLDLAPTIQIMTGGISHQGYPVVSHNTDHIISVDYITVNGNTSLAFYVDGEYYGAI